MDDTRLGGRVPAVLRIRLKYADVDTFIEKFSVNLSRGGLFIASKAPQPVGTTLKFEFQLSQGTPVVRGEGEVIWVKPFDPAAPTKPHGMGVRFVRLDPESKSVIDRALAWKEKSKAAASEAKTAGERPKEPTPPPPTPFAKPSPPAPPPIPADAGPPRIATEVRMVSAMEAMAKKNSAADEEPEAAPPRPTPPATPIARVAVAPVAPPRPLPPPAPRREKRVLPDPIDTKVEIEPHSGTNGTTTDLDALAADWGLTPERIAKTIEKVRAEGITTDGDALDRLMLPEG